MLQYHDLLERIFRDGTGKQDRTTTGTLSVFGHQMRFDLAHGFPLTATTKALHFKSIAYELLWFLKGDTNVKYLNEQRDRRDVDAEQVDLKERQAGSPASKYAPCWTRASETRRIIARVRSPRKALGPDSASAARPRSNSANRTVAAALCPCAKAASAASSSAPRPS